MRFWKRWKELLWDNPVTLKELRVGLRERRIFILQVLFLLLLLGVSLVSLPQMFQNRSSERFAEAGREFFYVLYAVQLIVLIFIAPALTCGSLSGERERHSLDMVLASRLSSGELVVGKLGFAVYCLVLLLFSALPLASISFFLGGMSPGQAFSAYIELFLFALLAAGLGLFASAREQRSNYSTVQAYLMVLLACLGLPFYMALRFDNNAPHITLGPSPWTFQQIWELNVFHFFLGAASYAILFICLKARHRLRPQAATLRAMAFSFILFYLFCQAWHSFMLIQLIPNHSNDTDLLLALYYTAHLIALGFFLNPNNLESSVERSAFQSSPYSRPIFWWVFFGLGLSVPGLLSYTLGLNSEMPLWGACLALFLLLLYPLNAWLAQRLFAPHWQYIWVYSLLLLLCCCAPLLGAFSEGHSILRLYFVSPLTALWSVGEHDMPEATPAHAVLFQLALTGLLGLAYLVRRRRRPAA